MRRSPGTPSRKGWSINSGGGLVPEVDVMEWKGPIGEDCLHVNVWTPGLKDGHKRPVMVWLHGGGFANGSANFWRMPKKALDAQNLCALCALLWLTSLGRFWNGSSPICYFRLYRMRRISSGIPRHCSVLQGCRHSSARDR